MFKVFTIFNAFNVMVHIANSLDGHISTVFAEPVCTPISQKEEALIPRQSASELTNSSLECWEFGLQNFNDSPFSFRPLDGDWIETNKLRDNSGAEFLTSGYAPDSFSRQ